jgi:mono/diheme cytochrome c family protein
MRVFTLLAVCLFWTPGCVITVRPIEALQPDRSASPEAADFQPETVSDKQDWPELLVLGARVFDDRCAVCHGDRGYGDGTLAEILPIRPRNYHSDPFRWGTRPSQIVNTVALGRSGIMPPFRNVISEREMWAVAYLVWSWIPPDTRESDTVDTLSHWKLPEPPAAPAP